MNTLEEKIKERKATLGEKINCSLEVLSPLHIGSGIKLQKNFDYLSEGDNTIIFTKEEIEKLLIENPEIIDEFDKQGFSPASYLKRISNPRSYNVKCYAKDILEFERNGEGIPYIPGSSFKGAVRTVLLYSFFNSRSSIEQNKLLSKIDYTKSKFASDFILKDLFGEDSNHNLFRAISFSDIYFDNSNLNLLCTYILSLSSENSFKWKNMIKDKPNSENASGATPIFSEMIFPGSKANFNIKLDDFLFTNIAAKSELRFDTITINELVKKINNYSKTKIQNEIEFIDKINFNNKLDILKKNLEEMEGKISLDITSEFIIRLSWGSGWKGMTGDFLNPEALKVVRNKLNLGKYGFDFPKSRKIVFEGAMPSYYTGWVKVKLNQSFSKNDIEESRLNKILNSNIITSENYIIKLNTEVVIPKESVQRNYVLAEIINDKSKPPKVIILDGDFKGSELDMPMGNLVNLGLIKGSEVYIEFQFDKKKKPIKAIYKDKK